MSDRGSGFEHFIYFIRGLDVRIVGRIVWYYRAIFAAAFGAVLLLAAIYLHIAKYQYDVTLLVTPVENSSRQLPSGLQSLASVASMAGINLAGSTDSNSFEIYLDSLTARPTANLLARDSNLMRRIFPDEWSNSQNRWREPPEIVHAVSSFFKGVIGVPVLVWHPPGGDELHIYIEQSLSIQKTRQSPIVTITLTTPDRQLGMDLLWKLHTTVDRMLRERQLQRSDQYIAFLTKELSTVTAADLRQSLIDGLSEQEKEKMMASSNVPFVADPFGRPEPSQLPTSPKLLLVLALTLFSGIIAGTIATVIRAYFAERRGVAAVNSEGLAMRA